MGNYLSQPIKDKDTTDGGDSRVMYASSAMQGWRTTMEDDHTAILSLKSNLSFFGVFDGHGGPRAAKYASDHLHDRILEDRALKENDYSSAMINGYLKVDEAFRNDPEAKNDPSGCTAVTALITPDNRLIVANAGDSRAVLSVRGEAYTMSDDHKPLNPNESDRIKKAGGYVDGGRVNGNLALSRALGDFEFKANTKLKDSEQIVTAYPETKEYKLDPDTEFLVLACDGIWDVLSNQEVVSFIRREISNNCDLRKTAENLMDHCLAQDSDRGSNGCDNMTVIIIAFLGGRTSEEWYRWISDQVKSKIGPEFVEKEAILNQGVPESEYPSMYDNNDDEEDLAISADASAEDFIQDDDDE